MEFPAVSCRDLKKTMSAAAVVVMEKITRRYPIWKAKPIAPLLLAEMSLRFSLSEELYHDRVELLVWTSRLTCSSWRP